MRCTKNLTVLFLTLVSTLALGEEYTFAELEPAGGTIPVPVGWTLEQRHQEHYMLWVIAEEIREDKSYDVGLAVQMYVNLSSLTGKTPEQFMRDFKLQYSSKFELLSECDESEFGDFIRICFESIEPATVTGKEHDHRVQHSLFWSNDLDIGVATVAGSPLTAWETNAMHFNAMSEIVLLDRSKFR